MMATLLPVSAAPAGAVTTELFFSEYIEGSSFNKALEIYNGTGSAVDLDAGDYEIFISFNGGTGTAAIDLTGTVADGDVFVVADDGAAAAIIAEADLTPSNNFFNGDDAVVLRKGGVTIDAFGQVGTDPGSQWPGGGADDTLRRKATVCQGDTVDSDPFDASMEWDSFAQDTFDGLGSHTATCNGGGPTDPVINEFVVNHTGSDTEAFVEVLGDPATDYSAFTVLEIEGEGSGIGTIDAALAIGTTDAGGYWIDDEDMENATLTILLVEGFTGSVGDDIDSNNDGTPDLTPWTRIVDDVATTDGTVSDVTYSSTVLAPFFDGNPFGAGGASRIPNGTDTDTTADWVRNDFDGFGFAGFPGSPAIGEAENTPGAANAVITVATDPFGACGDPATLIHEIQGSGPASSDVGSIREVEAVVTATFQDPGQIGGYFIQEEDDDADTDPFTSEGLRIFDVANTPNVGDVIRVRGSVAEYFDLTELNNVVEFEVCGTGVATPATVTLPLDDVDDLERYEGMAVTFPQSLFISEYFNFDRFGEIVLTTERAAQPTAAAEPGSTEAADLADLNARSRITVDDGRGGQNPDPAIHPNGEIFDLDNRFRGGDTVANLTGVLDYNFGAFKVQPTQGADYTSANPRSDTPDPVGGDTTVATFNVLNYFTTLDDGVNDICGPAGDQECRGADDLNEFERQRAKIVAAIAAIDADVVGLIEIENDTADVAVADLVSGLNDATGAGAYDYIATGPVGPDAIRVAIIYQPDSVTPYGAHAVLEGEFLDPNNTGEPRNRPALAQSFVSNANGGVFTVAVNHLKSKGSSCGAGDDDPEQGSCNLTRTLAAGLLADWLKTDPTGSGDGDFLIIGDLNSYDKEDPIDVLKARGYADLVYDYLDEFAYSYVFDGQLGYLDYIMANGSMASQVTDTTIWHINADEPDILDYDTSFKQPPQQALYEPNAFRSSDHDPVIVGLQLAPTPRHAKTDALNLLNDLLPTGDRWDDWRIRRAAAAVEKSLNPDYWVDDSHLVYDRWSWNDGRRVFDFERTAVSYLRWVDGPAQSEAQAVIDLLVAADAELAATAIAEAEAAGGNAYLLKLAKRELDRAQADINRNRPDRAIGHYKRAWLYANWAASTTSATSNVSPN